MTRNIERVCEHERRVVSEWRSLGGLVWEGANVILTDRAVLNVDDNGVQKPAKNVRQRWQVLDLRQELVGLFRKRPTQEELTNLDIEQYNGVKAIAA